MNRFNTSVFQVHLSHVLQLIMLVSTVVSMAQQQWTSAALAAGSLAITLIPFILYKAFSIHTPPPFLLVLVGFVFGSLFLGEAEGLYSRFWWWDAALHLGSGFLLGIFGFLLVYVLNGVKETGDRMRPGFVAFFAFLFAVGMGAFWELLEFFLDMLFTINMQTEKVSDETKLTDSMTDLIADTLGALWITVIAYRHLQAKGKPSFLGRWVTMFIRENPHLCDGD